MAIPRDLMLRSGDVSLSDLDMPILKLRKTLLLALILVVAFPFMVVYLTIFNGHSHGPNRPKALETARRFVETKQQIKGSTDMFISSINVTVNLTDRTVSHKTIYANDVPANGTTLKIVLPYPPIQPHESSHLDIDIDRVYGCGRKVINVVRPKEDRIPRIIHFSWKTEIIPSAFVDNLKTFVKYNPTWTYYFWTDNSTELFIKEKYPQLHQAFKEYPIYVSRYDAARYAIVHYYGGAYFDLDTVNLKSLDPLLETEECIVTPEPMEHAAVVLHMGTVLGNCVFLCKPNHGFFTHVLAELHKSRHVNDMMRAAGPIFLTAAFRTYIASCLKGQTPANESIHVMSGEYFLDYLKQDVKETLMKKCKDKNPVDSVTGASLLKVCETMKKRNLERPTISSKAYSVHLYFSTYYNENKIDNLPKNNIINIIPNIKMYTG